MNVEGRNCIVQITDPVLSKQKRLQLYVLCISLDVIVLQHSRIWIVIYKRLCFFPIKLSSPQCWSVSTVKTLLLPASSEAPKGSAPCHVPRGILTCMKHYVCSRSHVGQTTLLYTLGCSLISVTLCKLNKWGSLHTYTKWKYPRLNLHHLVLMLLQPIALRSVKYSYSTGGVL